MMKSLSTIGKNGLKCDIREYSTFVYSASRYEKFVISLYLSLFPPTFVKGGTKLVIFCTTGSLEG